MIKVTRLNNKEYFINAEFIYTVEATPDTVITTTDGTKLVVRENVDTVIDEIIQYKRSLFKDLLELKKIQGD